MSIRSICLTLLIIAFAGPVAWSQNSGRSPSVKTADSETTIHVYEVCKICGCKESTSELGNVVSLACKNISGIAPVSAMGFQRYLVVAADARGHREVATLLATLEKLVEQDKTRILEAPQIVHPPVVAPTVPPQPKGVTRPLPAPGSEKKPIQNPGDLFGDPIDR